MTDPFSQIPEVAIDYIRRAFAAANDKVTRTMSAHPAMHEETLDHVLVMELSATPAVFFGAEQVGISLESHWLGGRWMYDRWEIADIALFVVVRFAGRLEARKVALLQTKRLYSKEVPVAPIDSADYRIGIGRLVDRTDPMVPMSQLRRFRFDGKSAYGATAAGDEQVKRIDAYEATRGIPVYYGFYNPLTIPFDAQYPSATGRPPEGSNDVGVRVLSAKSVHASMASLDVGATPTFDGLKTGRLDISDPQSTNGWRIENFVADEVLRCRQGRRFDSVDDQRLADLLYRRAAPIAAAITMTIDVGGN